MISIAFKYDITSDSEVFKKTIYNYFGGENSCKDKKVIFNSNEDTVIKYGLFNEKSKIDVLKSLSPNYISGFTSDDVMYTKAIFDDGFIYVVGDITLAPMKDVYDNLVDFYGKFRVINIPFVTE